MKKQRITIYICTVILFVLILDTKTVIAGAKEGIDLCLFTVIPSLFPFFVISTMLNANLWGIEIPGIKRIGRICHIPSGIESIFLLGSLGGYPVGAKSIDEAFQSGQIDHTCAARMLGFCSNCGPAFIFGICGSMFTKWSAPWFLWMIQIISSLITGRLLPVQKSSHSTPTEDKKYITVQSALKSSIRSVSEVCGWIIAFRVIITLLNRWVLWSIPYELSVVISGILELANGCTGLNAITYEPTRFILCGCFLSFGGICVLMQTISVTDSGGLGWYVPGKLIQTGIVFVLSSITASILYSHSFQPHYFIGTLIVTVLIFVFKTVFMRKKDSHTEKVVV